MKKIVAQLRGVTIVTIAARHRCKNTTLAPATPIPAPKTRKIEIRVVCADSSLVQASRPYPVRSSESRLIMP